MTLFQDIEAMCGIIKHAPDDVDLDNVRALLRRASEALEIVSLLRYPSSLKVDGVSVEDAFGEYGSHSVTFTVQINEVQELLRLLYNYDEDW